MTDFASPIPARSEVFKTTLLASLMRSTVRTGVASGCKVEAQSTPDMTVKVNSGYYYVGGVRYYYAGGNQVISTADATYPRIDIVGLNSSGLVYIPGTAAAILPSGETNWKKFNQPYPVDSVDISTATVILALVHVGATVTTITNANIQEVACGAKNPRRQIQVIIDGGGAAITTGVKARIAVDYGCTIKTCTMVADQSGSIVVDIWKSNYASLPATDFGSITNASTPIISNAIKSQDSTLAGWTKTITAGDWLYFNVDSCSTITQITIDIEVESEV
jgi:hypothetical protein